MRKKHERKPIAMIYCLDWMKEITDSLTERFLAWAFSKLTSRGAVIVTWNGNDKKYVWNLNKGLVIQRVLKQNLLTFAATQANTRASFRKHSPLLMT